MISFASFCGANEISGVSTWLVELLLRLHRAGTSTSILLHGIGQASQLSPTYQRLLEAKVPTRLVPKPAFTEDGIRDTQTFLNEFKPRVFVPHCLEAFYYAADQAAHQGLPWIFTIHSDDPVYWAIANMVDLKHPLVRTVGVSNHICELVKSKLTIESESIAYGVKLPDRIAEFRAEPFRVVYVGRVVEEQKRISLVIESMIEACRQNSNIECLILGDGPQRNGMQALVAAQGLESRIRFLGRLNSEQVTSELLRSQAILIMSDYEGLPVALLEAMAAGVVPVARHIDSGIPEIVHHERTGLCVDDRPQQAAQGLVRLATDSTFWSSCSRAARNLVMERFTDNVAFDRWKNLLLDHSQRNHARYPLKLTTRIKTPVPPILAERDLRRPSILDRARNRIGRFWNRGKI